MLRWSWRNMFSGLPPSSRYIYECVYKEGCVAFVLDMSVAKYSEAKRWCKSRHLFSLILSELTWYTSTLLWVWKQFAGFNKLPSQLYLNIFPPTHVVLCPPGELKFIYFIFAIIVTLFFWLTRFLAPHIHIHSFYLYGCLMKYCNSGQSAISTK